MASAAVTDCLYWLRTSGASVKSVCDGYSQGIPRIRVDKALQMFVKFVLTLRAGSDGSVNPVPGT
jgi:hypothetical protein